MNKLILNSNKYILFIFFTLLLIQYDFSSNNTSSSPLTSRSIPAPSIVKLTNADSEVKSFEQFDALVQRFITKWGVTGASIAIAREGKLLYAKGYGYANREDNEFVEPYHLFRIASVSKLITAVAVLQLVDRDKLSLDTKVFGERGILNDSLYINYFDKRVEQITVEQLLNHSAGWTTRWGDQLFMQESIARQIGKELPITKDDIISFTLSKRLHFNPGSHSSYNNFGFLIAEKVIEKVSGKSYENYVKSEVFLPLGITDAVIAQNFDNLRYPSEVRYYEVPEAQKIPACDGSSQMVLKARGGNDIRTLGGAGGWVISSVSLMKFLMAIEKDNSYALLKPHTLEALTSRKQGFQPLGWKQISANGNKWRTGSFAGTSALAISRADGLQYVFITNSSPWSGAKFPYEVDRFMTQAFNRVELWPDRNLFETNNDHFFTNRWFQLSLPSLNFVDSTTDYGLEYDFQE
jgi:CubicO group peptidase (beta-lactamase class C family)